MAYVAKRTNEGKSKKEIIRCLKRHVAREIFRLLTNPSTVPAGKDLRTQRTNAGLTLTDVAQALGTWPIRISKLERNLTHDADLAHRYQLLLHPNQQAA